MAVVLPFEDREDAGLRLAARLHHLRDQGPVVLGIPRGGIVVARAVADALQAPRDVVVVRKLGVPHQPEWALGAIGEEGVRVVHDAVVRAARVSAREVAEVEQREQREVDRRVEVFRGGRPRTSLEGRTVVVVDDGVATGSTLWAACRIARARGAARVVAAVPVAPEGWAATLDDVADDVVTLATPEPFDAVGRWYRDFRHVRDDRVLECLGPIRVPSERPAHPPAGTPPLDHELALPFGSAPLQARATLPEEARALVVVAHGSNSGRHSPRSRTLAAALQRAGLGTLVVDLLTAKEELDRFAVHDAGLLTRRLIDVTNWARTRAATTGLPIGYVGWEIGAAAALWAAGELGDVLAVVTCNGRPGLARPRLGAVRAPVLLIASGDDPRLVALSHDARRRLRCPHHLAVVPGAGNQLQEPGALDRVTIMCRGWFVDHMANSQLGTSGRLGPLPTW